MKKFLALVLVGVMTVGTAVMAAGSPSANAVNATLEQAAKEDNMSIQEESNNALVDADAGIDKNDAIAVGVPQGTIINGVKTNFSIRLRRATKKEVEAGQTITIKGKKFRRALKVKNKPAGTVIFNVYIPSGADGVVAYQIIGGQKVQLTTAKVSDNKLSVAITNDSVIYLYK
ncbi:MAG: hypothetical protein J5525_05805 [Lachnospiraceae bacterium]|nr:hypothetical protein [Lachnospiraceae bacterium]